MATSSLFKFFFLSKCIYVFIPTLWHSARTTELNFLHSCVKVTSYSHFRYKFMKWQSSHVTCWTCFHTQWWCELQSAGNMTPVDLAESIMKCFVIGNLPQSAVLIDCFCSQREPSLLAVSHDIPGSVPKTSACLPAEVWTQSPEVVELARQKRNESMTNYITL